MKKLFTLILALSMLLTMTVAGAESAKTTVVFWNSWTGGDGDALQALVSKFNESQNEVHVDMTRSTSFGDMLQTSLPTKEAADLILLNCNDLNKYSSYLLPITDIWESTSLKAEDFSEAYLGMAKMGNEQYGIPFQVTTYMMYYNKDLLAAAGIEKIPTTFAEWTEASEKITALSTAEKPIYGSGLFYCYNGQNQSVMQRFGTGYMIEGDAENGFTPNLLGNQPLADSLIWMKNLYDNGYNPKERDIDSMMAAGQIGLMTNGGWLKGALDASGVNYGITKLPTVTGEDQSEWALGDLNCFMMTSSATEETKKAAYKFIEWWFTGSGLEAQEVTQGVDYSGITPNAEWSISMCYVNAYLPTVNSPEYQANETLVAVSPSSTAQVQMFAGAGTLFWSDVAATHGQMVEEWVFNGPTNPTYDDVQDFLAVYQDDLASYISEYYE